MVGASESGSKSSTNSSSSTTATRTYGNTTTSNPYVVSKTTNKGTTTSFQPNTALNAIYDFTNANIRDLLRQYIEPSTDNPIYQAQLEQYQKNLEESTRKALENNVIAPLAQRNMIRSSQATDLYNTLNKQNQQSIADFSTNLLANSQNDTSNIINNLMNLVYQGWNVVNGNQAQSLNASQGNSTTNQKTIGSQNTTTSGYNGGVNFLYS